jgi:hypothetical protein
MDSSSEFLFGHNPHTLAAGLPYPSHIAAKSTSIANTDASNAFAGALNLAQVVTMQRGAFGAAWPLTEFWHNRLTAPMRVVRNFLDPILSEAVARRRANGEEKVVETAGEREVQEGESLVEHLLHYIQGMSLVCRVIRPS